jgi:acetylornithine deacetylase/succinyl-diaminopimelate desuccinylase-like protein
METTMADWRTYLADNRDRFLDELMDFLRIPSVSSLPAHAEDVQRAAQWVARRLDSAGAADVQILPTGGHPVVTGSAGFGAGSDDRPTVMIYGHFDVQPADPVALWSRPPFEPALVDGRIYARGASDDKGNMLAPILAVEALLKAGGRLPVNVRFLFEGQEEIGSPQLPELLRRHRTALGCDVVFSADGGQWSVNQPSIVTGRRGLCALQIDVQGPAGDLHSGTYGGTVRNPIEAICTLLASLHTPDGRVAVAGFYDTVRSIDPEEAALMAAIESDDGLYARDVGAVSVYGESGFTTYERAWIRPTLEFNGIWGGFQGEGLKTVLPSRAHAKISCRLVPDQQPDAVRDLLTAHLQRQSPPGVTVSVTPFDGSAEPYLVPHDHPGNTAAAAVLTVVYGRPPYVVRMGGSIPVCNLLHSILGAHVINFSFSLKDENVHAPDEFLRLASFIRAQEAWGRLLEEAAGYRY